MKEESVTDQIENVLYGVNMGDPQPDVEPGDSMGRVAAKAVTRWLAAHDAEVAAKTLEDAADELRELDAPRQPHPIHWQYQVWLEARAAGIREGAK